MICGNCSPFKKNIFSWTFYSFNIIAWHPHNSYSNTVFVIGDGDRPTSPQDVVVKDAENQDHVDIEMEALSKWNTFAYYGMW